MTSIKQLKGHIYEARAVVNCAMKHDKPCNMAQIVLHASQLDVAIKIFYENRVMSCLTIIRSEDLEKSGEGHIHIIPVSGLVH